MNTYHLHLSHYWNDGCHDKVGQVTVVAPDFVAALDAAIAMVKEREPQDLTRLTIELHDIKHKGTKDGEGTQAEGRVSVRAD